MSSWFKRLLLTSMLGACLAAAFAPLASAQVGKLLGDVNDAVGGVLGGGGGGSGLSTPLPAAGPSPAPAPQAGVPPEYTPPAHGTNPHGQGTVGVVDVTPEDAEPLPYDPSGGSEDIVVGRARGEEEGDEYHGHITIASLLGTEIVGVDTEEGETASGPLEPVQEDLLDAVCDGSGNQICLEVLTADSETNDFGSWNRFAVADASLGGRTGINATAAESEGSIEEGGGCQRAVGYSRVASASAGGAFTVEVAESESESRACNDGSEAQENSSTLIEIGGQQVPFPPGCEAGDPNTSFDLFVASLVCHADDSSEAGGTQNDSPYGVREAVSVFVLPLLLQESGALKLTTAAGESHARAPGDDEVPPPGPGPDDPDPQAGSDPAGGGDGSGPGDAPDGQEAPSADAVVAGLPFTGADLPVMLAVGIAVMAGGLALMALADRRRKAHG